MVRWLAVPLVALLLPATAAAQERDFLFSHPRATLSLRMGVAAPTAESDIFQFINDELVTRGDLEPLERGDFAGFAVEGELAIRVHDRIDVALGLGHSQRTVDSEFADFIGTDDLPIEQRTEFARTIGTLGLKGYLLDRGRRISELAWVPYGWAPYLSAGGGFVVYDFRQAGEFVDFDTSEIFRTTYVSNGTAPAGYLGGGVDVSLGKHLLATGEARYVWAKDAMSRDFVDFDDIDLSGAQLALGLALRF